MIEWDEDLTNNPEGYRENLLMRGTRDDGMTVYVVQQMANTAVSIGNPTGIEATW